MFMNVHSKCAIEHGKVSATKGRAFKGGRACRKMYCKAMQNLNAAPFALSMQAELRSSKLPCIASKTFLRLEHTSISKEIQPKTLIKHSSKKFMSAGLHRQRAHRQLSLGVQCNALPGSLEILATNTLARDVTVTIVSAISATTLVKAFALLKKAGVHQTVSRKLVHITIGVVNVFSWPLWSVAPYARYFAALVPAIYSFRMLLVGTGVLRQRAFVESITRDGQQEEVLRGPLIYTLILMVSILVYWRTSPIGMTAVALMSGGDGAADLIGRKYGSVKLPWNRQKSWAGSLAMLICGWAVSVAFIAFFNYLGYFDCNLQTLASSLGIISFVATILESLPINQYIDDNIYVPISAAALGHYLFTRTALL